MAKLRQSTAILILSLLIVLQYYIFDQQDLVNISEIARYRCLNNPNPNPNSPSNSPALCISCIGREQYRVAEESSVYIKDGVNGFKVIAMPMEGVLSCEELLQFVSYELPMRSARDIKIEELGSTRELIKMLDIRITEEPVYRYQAPVQISTIALLQLKQPSSMLESSTIFTYSSVQSAQLTHYYSKLLSECSLILSIFCIFFYKFQHDEIRVGFVAVVAIGLMVLGESMLEGTGYLGDYGISLLVGFYFSKGLVSRAGTLGAMVVCLGVSVFVPALYSESLAALLALYVLIGRNKTFNKVGTLTIFCISSLIICVGFRQHHHWLSLPLRKIIQYTILTFSPLLMEIVSAGGTDASYRQIPTGGAGGGTAGGSASGLSLPGFQEEEGSEDQER